MIVSRYAVYQGYIRLNNPSYADYPVQGIDISHHQYWIEWSKLDKQQVQFVLMKATEGADHKDSLFSYNWKQAKKHQIPAGAYHFFSFCRTGKEQAKNFIESVPYDQNSLPPALDLEYGGNCQEANRLPNLVNEIDTFIQIVQKYYSKKVIIYTTHEFYDNYLLDRFTGNPFWIRDIIRIPKLNDNRQWVIWQFTNRGKLDGIIYPVDLNAFRGNKEDFVKFINDTIQ